MPSIKSFLTMTLIVVLVLAVVNRVPQLKAITGA
jgi:FtsH-binding integral membrane protein